MSEDDKPPGKPIVKAKLPSAKNINRPDFTPHGIGSQGRGSGPRPSALTAAKAKKRQRIGVAVVVVAMLAAAGGTAFYVTRPDPTVEVSGAFGKEPKVTIAKEVKVPKVLKVSDSVRGNGAKVANGDTTYVKFAFFKFAGAKKLGATYSRPQAEQVVPMVVGKSGVKGVDKGLIGHTVGSRVVLEVPPADGFGKDGQQLGLSETDSIVFVMDVLGTFPKTAAASGTEQKLTDKKLPKITAGKPGEAPKIEVPKNADAPEKMQVKTLIQGNGPALTANDTAIVHYEGKIWKGGRTFDSSWQKGQPAPMPLNTKGGAQGFFTGLTGQKVGSRVLLVLPPKDGYGKTGNPQAGIKKDDTLVFLVDVLGTLPAN